MRLRPIEVARGSLYTQGAHVASWTPPGQKPVLFMSGRNSFEPGKPVRGGVPIIFPWFGARPEGTHGYARSRLWEVEHQEGSAIALLLDAEPFRLRFQADFAETLSMDLTIENRSDQSQVIEMALHTYLAVSDVRTVSVGGLDATEYIDKMDDFRRKLHAGSIHIEGPVDRVFLNTTSTCTVTDPLWQREIAVAKTGSNTTVVWNPFKELPDLDNWAGMICVETANAADNSVALPANGAHTMSARISVEHLS